MKQYNVFLTLRGPLGEKEVPVTPEYIEATDLNDAIESCIKSIPPAIAGLEVIGLKVVERS